MRRSTLIAFALGYVLVCSLSSTARATSYHGQYGTYTGSTVTFSNVTEDSSTSSTALFGTPSILGDSLSFSPSSFGVYVRSGASAVVSSTINTTITSVGVHAIDRILLTQHGDYSLMGSRGTAATNAYVLSPLTFTVSKVDGRAIDPLIVHVTEMDFIPYSGYYQLPDNKGSGIAWDGSGIFDVTDVLRANGYDGYATQISLTWENTLSASSEVGTIAYIKSKEAGGTGVTILPPTSVPEPVTFLGVLAGLAGLATYIRRRTTVR